ncbi:hypothetical protein G3T14_24105 [Methylobacterium sp. BTF04]|nr:hypothetical protein [Methylobacterium sp. BTF04]
MPLYFFHVHTPNDLTLHDQQGAELGNRTEALAYAHAEATKHRGLTMMGDRLTPGWSVEVLDEAGFSCGNVPIEMLREDDGYPV